MIFNQLISFCRQERPPEYVQTIINKNNTAYTSILSLYPLTGGDALTIAI